MRSIFLISILCASMYAQQTPATWWASSDSSQKALANGIYEIGFRHGDRGHTAVCIAQTESALGMLMDHGEDSHEYFGLSPPALRDMGCGQGTIDSLRAGTLPLERQTILAVDYYFLCRDRLIDAGYSPAEARFWSYPKYSTGSNYLRFRRRGEVFQMRVKYLKEIFK